jgi:hypothetical protein
MRNSAADPIPPAKGPARAPMILVVLLLAAFR